MDLKCKCGSNKFFLRRKGSAIGAYCTNCSKWLKWVGKADISILSNNGYVVHNEDYKAPTEVVVPTNIGCVEETIIGTSSFPVVKGVETFELCDNLNLTYLRGKKIEFSFFEGILTLKDSNGLFIADYSVELKH